MIIKTITNSYLTSVMSHTFTLTGSSSVLSADFYPPIELSTTSKYGLALVGFYTYNSIFNIDENNNSFGYIIDENNSSSGKIRNDEKISHLLTIPPGAYEIDEIGQAMLTALKESTRDDSDEIFSLTANNNTLQCEMKSKYDIDLGGDKSIAKMLGFDAKVLKKNEKHQSVYNVDIMKVRIIRVDCNIISGAFLNSSKCHILFEFDIDVEAGYKITKEPQNIIYMPIIPEGRQFIDNISLRILDDDGDLIDFRGEKIIIKLELKKIA